MAGDPSQKDRLFTFESPLGKEKLIPRRFWGREALSELFTYQIELASADPEIDPDQIIGRRATLGLRGFDGEFRYFDGFVSRFEQLPHGVGPYTLYFCELRPWLWFLTLTTDCYIFQDLSVPDVIKKRFEKWGFQDFQMRLYENHVPWEYCVQYRETVYDFISRLCELEGITWYHKQENGKHTLILTDQKSGHEPCPGKSSYKYEKVFGIGTKRGDDVIYDWQLRKSVRPGKYAHQEYHFENPETDLTGEEETTLRAGADPKYEIYDFPGEYEEKEEGRQWARSRQQENEVDYHVAEGRSNSRTLHAGYKLTLREHERSDQNDQYLITEVIHEGAEGPLYFGDEAEAASYENTFKCIPAQTQFRPKRRTKKHQMLGKQTAKVVGPSGEEIYTDKYSRVKVKFNWDRVRPKDKTHEGASCWIRVMQPWTGVEWGQIWIPRIGQEVVVDFFEGDPDRPVIVGCLYNSDNMPPYSLPGKMNRSGWKTRSTKNGGAANFNELRFDDTKGEELVLLHAEKDLDVSVENDFCELVERDHHNKVERHHYEEVGGDRHTTVGGVLNESIGGKMSLTCENAIHQKAQQDILVQSQTGQVHIKAGQRVILDAPMGITLLGGGSFVNISPSGVSIQGAMVYINSGSPSSGPGSPSSPTGATAPTLPNPMPRD